MRHPYRARHALRSAPPQALTVPQLVSIWSAAVIADALCYSDPRLLDRRHREDGRISAGMVAF
jgi:hypothetical protein